MSHRHPSARPSSRRRSRRAPAALAVVAALSLAACADGDDEDAASTTVEGSATDESAADAISTTTASTVTATSSDSAADGSTTTTATDATTAPSDDGATATPAPGGSDATIVVQSLEDVPQECQDLLAEFLRLAEPTVSEVDWTTATFGDFQRVSDELATGFESLDADEQAAGCDAYDFAEDQASLEAAIELAEREAPGTVPWLEFLGSFTESPETAADLPADCDGAIAYIEALVADGNTLADVPFSEIDEITQVINVVTTECDTETATEFLDRPEINDFLS